MALGIAFGTGIGAVLFATTGEAFWIAIGIAIGVAVGAAAQQARSD